MNKKPDLQQIVESSVKTAMETTGFIKKPAALGKSETVSTNSIKESIKNAKGTTLKEALIAIPKSFILKTEKLSARTKEAHELLYKKYVEAFNKVSSELDSVNLEEANSNNSAFRNKKENECYNMNAIKLHELYFTNISDMASQITVDSIPYIKLSRMFGTFEKWQLDFIACCMSSREGWAMTVYEPYKNVYTNVVVDGNSNNIPLGAIPVIVMDMWSHSYYKDYANDKKSYIVNMMRELNWNVIEARMMVSEQSSLHTLYKIAPIVNGEPELMIRDTAAHAEPAPIHPTAPSNTSPLTGQTPSAPTFASQQLDKRIP
jgi:Fe-Mn family superoxide dismutase